MSSNSSTNGVGIFTVIFLILLFLKLFGVIAISWWWVFAPVIIEVVIFLVCIIILGMFIKK